LKEQPLNKEDIIICMNCDGKKEIDGAKCPVCNGNGFLKLNNEKK